MCVCLLSFVFLLFLEFQVGWGYGLWKRRIFLIMIEADSDVTKNLIVVIFDDWHIP